MPSASPGLAEIGRMEVAKRSICLLVVWAVFGLNACRVQTILRSAAQEDAFRRQYIGKPFYTAMVLRPYAYEDGYLIDLTGEFPETAVGTVRAPLTIPLGTLISIAAIDRKHLMAHVAGYTQPFHLLVRTRIGTAVQLGKELAQVLSETPPLQTARAAMRPFIARQEVARGMSRHEVYMSWGRPDKINSASGSSGFLEEWVYFDRRMHLFLHDGLVTNWQQF